MSSDKDLYVSLEPNNYIHGKSDGLKGQANLLKSLKHLHNLKVLSRQKRDLRDRLFKIFESVSREVDKIEEKFPTPEIPSSLKRKLNKVSKVKDVDNLDLKIKRDYSKRDEIDAELFEIQRKLSSLNG